MGVFAFGYGCRWWVGSHCSLPCTHTLPLAPLHGYACVDFCTHTPPPSHSILLPFPAWDRQETLAFSHWDGLWTVLWHFFCGCMPCNSSMPCLLVCTLCLPTSPSLHPTYTATLSKPHAYPAYHVPCLIPFPLLRPHYPQPTHTFLPYHLPASRLPTHPARAFPFYHVITIFFCHAFFVLPTFPSQTTSHFLVLVGSVGLVGFHGRLASALLSHRPTLVWHGWHLVFGFGTGGTGTLAWLGHGWDPLLYYLFCAYLPPTSH